MPYLYITSWDEAAGKSALCVGIGKHLQDKDKKVAYLKPLVLAETPQGIDGDAQFIKQALKLEESVESLCPLIYNYQVLKAEIEENEFNWKLKQACSAVAGDKDVILLEGLCGLEGDIANISCQITETLNAKVIIVVGYSVDHSWEKIAAACRGFGERLIGVVINKVPQTRRESILSSASPLFKKEGVKVLGAIPEERLLLTVSIGEIAEHLQAVILNAPEASEDLIENLMIGALCVDPGIDYLSRKANKAVITRSERPDIQLAALATSTKCLILTGDMSPISEVLRWAEEKRVPILLTKQDTLPTVSKVEETFPKVRFRQQQKMNKLEDILSQHFDFEAIYQEMS